MCKLVRALVRRECLGHGRSFLLALISVGATLLIGCENPASSKTIPAGNGKPVFPTQRSPGNLKFMVFLRALRRETRFLMAVVFALSIEQIVRCGWENKKIV
jgi:hypothetical protein